jgi:ATP-binding cassette subfamily F protein uup
MLEPADVLVLDEPTNDLDLASLEVLEESIEEFPGAVILVTHDRAMLARLATQILALDGLGGSRYFADYEEWERRATSGFAPPPTPQVTSSQASPAKQAAAPASAPSKPKRKLNYKEQQELDAMEKNLAKAEADVKAHEAQMNDPAVVADHRRMDEACRKLGEAQAKVATLYARWTELEG